MREATGSERETKRHDANVEFIRRLFARDPEARARHANKVPSFTDDKAGIVTLETTNAAAFDRVLESIVHEERPVLFVHKDNLDVNNVSSLGPEAEKLVNLINANWQTVMKPRMPLIGRIDVAGFPGNDYVGTGWFVDAEVVVTNRHVASLVARWDGRRFVFSRGITGGPMAVSVNSLHEFDDNTADETRRFEVLEVLYIEPEQSPHDIAFLRLAHGIAGDGLNKLEIADADVSADTPIVAVGYPAMAPKSVIADQEVMRVLFRERYKVKRAAPGYAMADEHGVGRHDCTTLGGNSGSALLDAKTGKVVGLHFAGLYQEANYAIRASVLRDYVTRKRWNNPPLIDRNTAVPTMPVPALPNVDAAVTGAMSLMQSSSGSFTAIIPLTVTVSLGGDFRVAATLDSPPPRNSVNLSAVEASAVSFWKQRPFDVLAVRVGFDSVAGRIGDFPHIAASVPASRLSEVQAAAPRNFQGVPVVYYAASVEEQIEALPTVESSTQIAYDDAARAGPSFSFATVEGEPMVVRAHVGPEYSWDELRDFLASAREPLVSAIYEFHARHIKDAIEDCLNRGLTLRLVMDNASFGEVKNNSEFDRQRTFASWERRFGASFERIVAPEGTRGLISDSYHIKVTVSGNRFWLSSGNWKASSSQPIVTPEQRENAVSIDLPGNREWHVVVENATLAERFRAHINQDFERSKELGGGSVPVRDEAAEVFFDVPLESSMFTERAPPGRILEPKVFSGTIKVTPLLTPDGQGEIFSRAVMSLIRSAEDSLLFQIPYISMPSNPSVHRGVIDDLIAVLTEKLLKLRDARVLLRTGGSGYSNPVHCAWYFKSKGVDIGARLRRMENHHTKGMIVDGRQVLIGSNNWSRPGVSLNRDASLIFDHAPIAEYFATAFQIDWDRAVPIDPRKHNHPQNEAVRAAVGPVPPIGFRRVSLSQFLKDD